MMNHYRKEHLTTEEAAILEAKAYDIVKDWAEPVTVSHRDIRKSWSYEKLCNVVIEQEVNVYIYMTKEDHNITDELAKLFELVSSL